MNIDLTSSFGFGDADGLRHFFLDHRFIHDQTAVALTAKFNVPASTFGLSSSSAEQAWAKAMQEDKQAALSAALRDWLQYHAQIHTETYTLLGNAPTAAPDLSTVDFSSAAQFYDWMQAHQEMHDYEQSALGLS